MMRFLEGEISDFSYDQSKIVIFPLGYEQTTSYGKGTANGPKAVLEASPYLEIYDEELDAEPFRQGIFTIAQPEFNNNPESDFETISRTVLNLLEDEKFVISIGGEHSVSFPLFRAFHQVYSDLSIVQLDAHADLRDTYQGTPYSHACVMHRILELTSDIVQLGIRSLSIEEAQLIKAKRIRTVFAHQMYRQWPGDICDSLGENVYVTIDVDFFDPSFMPSTGTPEPGGFFWPETLAFLRKLFATKNVVGCDVVELNPIAGLHAPDFAVARLIYKLMGYKFYL